MTAETNASRGVHDDLAAARAAASSDPAAAVAQARADLAATLDEIQDRLNVRKRIRTASEENPIALVAVAAGVVAALVGAGFLVVRALRR